MKAKILFIERKASAAVSIEKVFRQINENILQGDFTTAFQQLRFSNDWLGTIKNLLTFKKAEADIYHVTGHVHYIALILPKNKTILTVHDAGILHIRSGLRRYVLKKLLFDLPLKRLKFVTAVSEATKKELVFYTKCEANKIRVIENPLREQFRFHPSQKKRFASELPVILQIGTTANKNLANLIKALEGISCQLNIIGELDRDTLNSLEEKKIVYENRVNLSDSEIREEYAKADIVAFCSTFEGFGLPIIEAQAMLTPVITSDISPLREVAGENAAAFADPSDFESIRHGIRRIINDESFRKTLVTGGIENVKRYKPEKAASAYEALYREILSGNSRLNQRKR